MRLFRFLLGCSLFAAAAALAQPAPTPPVAAAAARAGPGPADDPGQAGRIAPAPGTEGKKDEKWDVNARHGQGREVAIDTRTRHLDVARRLARRPRDRVRPAGRPLRHPDRGRRGARHLDRPCLGHAAALLARRAGNRLHLRPRRRRQYLGGPPRRLRAAPDHQGGLPPAQPGRLDARRQFHRRPQAFHLGALVGRGRDVALSPHRRRQGRRRADDQGAHQAEGHQRAGLLARRPLPLFLRRRDAGRHFPIFEGRQRPDLCDPAARPADRRDRDAGRAARAARSARRPRPTARAWPSSAASATNRR